MGSSVRRESCPLCFDLGVIRRGEGGRGSDGPCRGGEWVWTVRGEERRRGENTRNEEQGSRGCGEYVENEC